MLEPRHEGAPRRGRLLGALTFVAALSVGCASILGIEDARCDETLDPQCAGGQPDDTSEDDDRDEDTAEAGADSGLADDDDDTDDAAVTDDDTDDLAVTDDDTDDLAVTDEDTSDDTDDDTDDDDAAPVDDTDDADDGAATDDDQEAPEPTPEERKALLCDSYCELLETTCVDADAQFKSKVNCAEVCEQMMLSEAELDEDDPPNNTIECRLAAVTDAAEAGEVAANCQHAGMMGTGQCGDACEVYCSYMELSCEPQFEQLGDCMAACAEVPRSGVPFADEVPNGGNLECRVSHLRLATIERNPGTHCPHAAGAAPCAQ